MAKTHVTIDEAFLTIGSPSFKDRLECDFIYHGKKIAAEVLDRNFYKLIEDGEKIKEGDSFVAKLRISQRWDNESNAYNWSYVVVKLSRYIARKKTNTAVVR